MHQPQNELVKILFRFNSSVLEEDTTETMWAQTIDGKKGLYKIDNIPFYAPMVACGDMVFAEYDAQEKMLAYRETLEYSGNSTVQVVIMNNTENTENIRQIFQEMGCESEGMGSGYFVMCIPADLDYIPIKLRLEKLSDAGVLDYAEPLLSDKHRY